MKIEAASSTIYYQSNSNPKGGGPILYSKARKEKAALDRRWFWITLLGSKHAAFHKYYDAYGRGSHKRPLILGTPQIVRGDGFGDTAVSAHNVRHSSFVVCFFVNGPCLVVHPGESGASIHLSQPTYNFGRPLPGAQTYIKSWPYMAFWAIRSWAMTLPSFERQVGVISRKESGVQM